MYRQEAQDELKDASREVQESDVYRLVGKTLYLLNAYRGLQIIDLANADAPRLVGRAEIFGQPREMYVDSVRNKAYVLVSDAPSYDENANILAESQVAVVDFKSPTAYKSLSIPGYIVESRQVGEVIYVVSNEWKYDEETGMSSELMTVKSIDVAAAAGPRVVATMELEGSAYQIHASSEYLFIAKWDDGGSTIRALDIRDPKGQMAELAKMWVPGQVFDRFQMNMDTDTAVFRVVSNHWSNGSIFVHTFSMPQGEGLGKLELPNVGQLLATKYDGDKAYIVHIQRIDPLDVIDLSNPAEPTRLSTLEIPGWLENLEIRGDRVIGIGFDSGRVAVALYDVSNGSNTRELARVFLGEGATYSWTNFWDSRTFKFLDDKGLLLVPFGAYDQNRSYQAVQLIDVDFAAGTLQTRGRVDQAGMAIRSFSVDERIGSFTDARLTTATIRDRDKPYVTGDLELSRNITAYTKVRGAGIQLVADWNQPTELRAVPLDKADAELREVYSRFQVKGAERIYTTGSYVIVSRRDWNYESGMSTLTLQAIDYRNPWKPIPAGEVTVDLPSPIYGYASGAVYPEDVLQMSATTFLVVNADPEMYVARLISFADPKKPMDIAKTVVPVVGELLEARVVGSALYMTGFEPIEEEKPEEVVTDETSEPIAEESESFSRRPPWWGQRVQKGRYYLTRVAVFSKSLEASSPVNIPGLFVDADSFGRLVVLDSRVMGDNASAIDKALDTLKIRFTTATAPKGTTPGTAVLRDLLDVDDSAQAALVRGNVAYYTTTEGSGTGYPMYEGRRAYMPWHIGSDWTLHAVDIFGNKLVETGELLLQKNGAGTILDIQTVGLYTYAFTTFSGYGLGVFDVTDAFAMGLYRYIPSSGWFGDVLVDPRASYWSGEATVSAGMYGVKSIPLPRF
jgi:hypothetical protein